MPGRPTCWCSSPTRKPFADSLRCVRQTLALAELRAWLKVAGNSGQSLKSGRGEIVPKLFLGPSKGCTRFIKTRHNSNACEKFSRRAILGSFEPISGQPHSTTLARFSEPRYLCKVLESGCRMRSDRQFQSHPSRIALLAWLIKF